MTSEDGQVIGPLPEFEGEARKSPAKSPTGSRAHITLRRVAIGSSAVLLFVYAIYLVLDPFGDSLDPYFDNGVPDLLIAMAAFACFFRAARWRHDRAAWLVIGTAVLFTAIGEFYWNAIIAHQENPPFPSVADLFYLAFYPVMFCGLMMLALNHLGKIRLSLWLHCLIAVLTVSALDTALVFDTVRAATTDSGWANATNLAYPLADIFLLMSVIGVWALSSWRPNAMWRWIGGGMLVYAIGDAIFAYQSATTGFEVGGLVDMTWPLAAAMLLVAVTRREKASARRHGESSAWLFAPTAVFSTISVGILAWDHFDPVGDLAFLLAVSATLVTLLQMGLAFLENSRLVRLSERDASIDLVTEIPNRRRLMVDLERACSDATDDSPTLLALFDLDGFKDVNDARGHAFGDEVLKHFAARLTDIASVGGTAYRLGGDEFCLILAGDLHKSKPLLERAAAALVEHGEGFDVTSSFGFAILPGDTRDANEALRIADRRMYEVKPFRVRANRRASRVGEPPAASGGAQAQSA